MTYVFRRPSIQYFTKKRVTASKAYPLALAAGAFNLTGQTAATHKGLQLPLAAGSFALSGNHITVGFGLNENSGSYSLSGHTTTDFVARDLSGAGGTFHVSGSGASPTASRKLSEAAGAFALSGDILKFGFGLNEAAGQFSLIGNTLTASKHLSATLSPGSFAETGHTAVTAYGRQEVAASGSFSYTGHTAGFGFGIAEQQGNFSIAGLAASFITTGLNIQYNLGADPGIFTLAGHTASMKVALSMTEQPGTLHLTGSIGIITNHGGLPVSTVTMGTNATNALTALCYSKVALDADMATINNLIKVDVPVASGEGGAGQFTNQGFLNDWFTKDGHLYIPNRGVLKVLQGDFIAVDPQTGWPILISGGAAASNPSWTHT